MPTILSVLGKIAIGPGEPPAWAVEAVAQGGGSIVDIADAEALIWTAPREVDALKAALDDAPDVRWVQLPWAGIEEFAAVAGLLDDDRQWTCGKGVYAEPVAEHALALGLAGLRDLPERIGATSWGRQSGVTLYDGNVTILGGGGITEALIPLLTPMRVEITVVRRHDVAMEGADRVLSPDRLGDALPGADLVVLALALTAETRGIINRETLQLMERHAWLVNVARGQHIVTDDLVDALRAPAIGGAALDVTDPEPLPPGHPLWDLANCILTPHTANTQAMAIPHLRARIRENVARFIRAEALIGPVDKALGY